MQGAALFNVDAVNTSETRKRKQQPGFENRLSIIIF
jgi:hypothetical protein